MEEVHIPTLPDKLPIPPSIVVRSPSQYFQLPTTMAAVGPRGRGKTYNLCLWNKWMFDNDYFTRFFVISPSRESNPPLFTIPTRSSDVYSDVDQSIESLNAIIRQVEADANWFKEMTDKYTKAYKKYLKREMNISKMDKSTISYLRGMQRPIHDFYVSLQETHASMEPKSRYIEYILSRKPSEPDKMISSILGTRYDDLHPWFFPPPSLPRPAPLLFIDDCSHSPIYAKGQSNPLVNLTLRHRHIGGPGFGISIQFAVQTFKSGVPKALRQNTMQFLIFKTNDLSVVHDIYEEVGAFCTKDEFLRLYYQAIRGTHDFLCIDVNSKSEQRVFRRGFDTFLLLDRENMSQESEEEGEEKDESKIAT